MRAPAARAPARRAASRRACASKRCPSYRKAQRVGCAPAEVYVLADAKAGPGIVEGADIDRHVACAGLDHHLHYLAGIVEGRDHAVEDIVLGPIWSQQTDAVRTHIDVS